MRFKPFLFHHGKKNGAQNATPLLGFEKMSVKLPLPKSWITFHIISHKQKRRKLLFLSQLFTTDLQWYSNVTSHIFNIPFLYLQIQFASKHDKLLTFFYLVTIIFYSLGWWENYQDDICFWREIFPFVVQNGMRLKT